MKRQKVGAILTLSLSEVKRHEEQGVTRAALDKDMWTRLEAMIENYIEKHKAVRLGKINHLIEQYPEPRISAPVKSPNQGTMVDWRAWAFIRIPE